MLLCGTLLLSLGCGGSEGKGPHSSDEPSEEPSFACEQVRDKRQKAAAHLAAGWLFRALDQIAEANQRCKDETALSWPTEVVALAELGRASQARALAQNIANSPQSSSEAKQAAEKALSIIDERAAADGEQLLSDCQSKLAAGKQAEARARCDHAFATMLRQAPTFAVRPKKGFSSTPRLLEYHKADDAVVVFDDSIYFLDLSSEGKHQVWFAPAKGKDAVDLSLSEMSGTIALAHGEEVSLFKTTFTELAVDRTLSGQGGAVNRVQVSVHASYVIAGGADGRVRQWDIKANKLDKELDVGAPVTAINFDQDNWRLAAGGADGRVVVWDWKTGKETGRVEPNGEPVRDLQVTVERPFDKDTLAFLRGSKLLLWRQDSGKIVSEVPVSPEASTLELAMGRTMIVLQPEELVLVTSGDKGHKLRIDENKKMPGIVDVAASDDSSFVTVLSDGTINVHSSAGHISSTVGIVEGKRAAFALLAKRKVAILGEDQAAAEGFLECMVGERAYPFELCKGQVKVEGYVRF